MHALTARRAVHMRSWHTWLQGTFLVRDKALLVSHHEQLYMVGGAGPYSQSDRLMMTCSSDTQCWEPVKGRDEPFAGLSCACAGEFAFP